MKAKTKLTEQSYFQTTTTFAKIPGQSSCPWSLLPLKSLAIHLGLTDEIKNRENHENSLSALDTIEGSSLCTVLQLTHVSTLEELEHDLMKSCLSAVVWLGSEEAHALQGLPMEVSCLISLETLTVLSGQFNRRLPTVRIKPCGFREIY